MTESPVRVEGLTKEFRDPVRGVHRAVDDVSFECSPGRIFGLLGPNAAGKTTTLRMLATILTPTRGTIHVGGVDIVREPEAARRNLGFLTSSTGLYERMTPREFLRFYGRLYEIPRNKIEKRIDELLVRFALVADADRLCGTLSTGTQQKVNVARSVIHDPPVLIFDEPTANLDIVVARTVIEFLRDSRERGRAILLSGHRMEEVGDLCDDVGLLHDGRLQAAGKIEDLYRQYGVERPEDLFFAAIVGTSGETTA